MIGHVRPLNFQLLTKFKTISINRPPPVAEWGSTVMII